MQGINIFITSVLFCLPFIPNIRSGEEELVDWKASRKLSWSDYKANPDRGSGAAASTTTYLGIEYSIKDKTLSYKIQCSFSKDRSWGLNKTDYILAHEQGHFDIAEIFARKLNKELSEYSFNTSSCKKDLQEIYERIVKEKEDMQNAYDRETNHSIKKDKQTEWLKKIAALLDEYAAYTNYD